MPISPKNWQDSPSTATPINAAALEDLETRVTTYGDDSFVRQDGTGLPASVVSEVGDPTATSAANTAAIQAAINAGGVVRLAAGVLNHDGLTIKTGAYLQGAGIGSTTLKLSNGANTHSIQTDNYATLTGGGTGGGPHSWGISGLTIDGNKANQTSGHGLAIYGFNYRLNNFEILNCKQLGIRTDWQEGATWLALNPLPNPPSGTASNIGGFEESLVTNFKVHHNDGGGIYYAGPHDTQWLNGIVWENGTTWLPPVTPVGVEVGPNCGYAFFFQVHVWGFTHNYAWKTSGSPIRLIGCQGEGAATAQVLLLDDICEIRGGIYFGDTSDIPTQGDRTAVYGIVTGDATHHASGCVIDTTVHHCDLGAWNSVNGITNVVKLWVFNDSGTLVPSVPDSTDWVDIYNSNPLTTPTGDLGTAQVALYGPGGAAELAGLTVDGKSHLKGSTYIAPTVAQMEFGVLQLITHPTTGDVLFVGSQTVQIPNSGQLAGFSDAYSTLKYLIDSATGELQTLGGLRFAFSGGVVVKSGAGSPAGVVTGAPGSLWLRTDGGAGTSLYVKESGTGNTGWVAK